MRNIKPEFHQCFCRSAMASNSQLQFIKTVSFVDPATACYFIESSIQHRQSTLIIVS